MSSKKKSEFYDGWDGLANEIGKHAQVKRSQCNNCLNEDGPHKCKVFGDKPYKYASALANVPCPERE